MLEKKDSPKKDFSEIDLSDGFIEIYDQGNVGSCLIDAFCAVFNYHLIKGLGMAQKPNKNLYYYLNKFLSFVGLGSFLGIDYYASSGVKVIDQEKRNKFKNITPFRPSRYYLYYYACLKNYKRDFSLSGGGGSSLEALVNAFKTYGILRELNQESNNDWMFEKIDDAPSWTNENVRTQQKFKFKYPNVNLDYYSDEIKEAYKWRGIITHKEIYEISTDNIKYTQDELINKIKDELNNSIPVIIYMPFLHFTDKNIIDITNFKDVDENLSTNDHVMVIVGYYEDNDGQFFKVRNSWGKDFGINGYCFLSYELFNPSGKKIIKGLYTIDVDLDQYNFMNNK
jgi:hypothetical protein